MRLRIRTADWSEAYDRPSGVAAGQEQCSVGVTRSNGRNNQAGLGGEKEPSLHVPEEVRHERADERSRVQPRSGRCEGQADGPDQAFLEGQVGRLLRVLQGTKPRGGDRKHEHAERGVEEGGSAEREEGDEPLEVRHLQQFRQAARGTVWEVGRGSGPATAIHPAREGGTRGEALVDAIRAGRSRLHGVREPESGVVHLLRRHDGTNDGAASMEQPVLPPAKERRRNAAEVEVQADRDLLLRIRVCPVPVARIHQARRESGVDRRLAEHLQAPEAAWLIPGRSVPCS